MSTSIHPHACRCSLHVHLAARRHACYRQLAEAILGPAAPRGDVALANALAEHASLLQPLGTITPLRPRRAA